MTGEVITLDGKSLTIDNVVKVAREGAKVEISAEAMSAVQASRQLIQELSAGDIPVYGLNRGVGVNKDRRIEGKYIEEFNRNLILSHCAAVQPEANEEKVRAIMLARLNTLLLGCAGIQPAIVMMYKEFLNQHIHPVIPERGSVGAADIVCLSHIGLTMIGEGEVHYRGIRMPAAEALQKAGLKPVVLGPKDGLAIVSSNALAAGAGALVLKDIADLLDMADIVFALSLEGIKGNVGPLDEAVYKVRPFPGQEYSAERVRRYLAGSYLWQTTAGNSLQDPLSFRGACHVHGSVRDALAYAAHYLAIQLNSSDDNPCVLVDRKKIISCANYEATTWVLAFEMLGIALSHLSKISCYRTIKLGTPQFTGLSRFLTPVDTRVIAYGTLQKTISALDTEIRHLSNPATADYFSLSGDIEDHANNSPLVVRKTAKIVDNLYYILAIELMHAAQAVDLRKVSRLGEGTTAAYELLRANIPFLDRDRNLSEDIRKAYYLLKSGQLLRKVREVTE